MSAPDGATTEPGDVRDRPESSPVLSSETVWRSGRVVEVRTDRVVTGGGVAVRDVVVHPGAVGIVALDAEDRVALLQQYRHPVGRLLWEPPAGLLDVADEPPLEAAKRELYEEAHLEAGRWDVLVDIFTSPGMTDEAVRIYLARDVRESDRERHQGEFEEHELPLRWVPLDRAVTDALGGRLHNPLAVSGVLAAAAARAAGWTTLRPADADWPEMSEFTGSEVGRSAPHGAQ